MQYHAFLNLNELPYAPCDRVVRAAQQACARANRYPEPDAGTLRAALAERWGVTPDWVVASGGSAAVIQQMMIASGQSEIAFGWPSFDAFPAVATGLRMAVRKVELRGDGACDLKKLRRAITQKTSMVIVCTPNTPTGGIVHHDELADFLKQVPSRVLVLIDEAYGEFVRDDHAVRSLELVRAYPNAVLSRTFSKAHGMAGFRVGYAIAQPELAGKIRQAGIPFSVPLPAQAAALAALANEQESTARIDTVLAERSRLAATLRELGAEVVAGHGNFVWLPVGELAQHVAGVLGSHGVAVKALMPYGVRITVGTEDETDHVINTWKALDPLAL